MKQKQKLSIIIPFHNEAENLPELLKSLQQESVLKEMPYEIVLVDDGSLDDYRPGIKEYLSHENIFLVKMGRQMGKGKALNAGLRESSGDVIVFMDADLQDDPADLRTFLDKIHEGYDLVNGVRFDRQDTTLVKIYSKSARWFLKRYLHSPFTDINCGFKIFRRKLLDDIAIYGNNFRFFPLAAFYEGYKVSEVPVHNRPRLHGKSKYGAKKLFIGLIDMGSAYFLYKFAEQPLHFFGSIGSVFAGVGFFTLAIITYQRIFEGILLYRRPALQYATFLIILGIQIIVTGILGELTVYLHKKKS
ncbi:glycosyltransferase family 2 protein [Candidatus Woesebacteria bacterium]|nr:glycosyltransferase family 2 protein [Candidatus Woesebacteria bacterium]